MGFRPECELVDASSAYSDVEVLRVHYDVTSHPELTVELSSQSHGNIGLTFERCAALRVIDEGQICEFWNTYSTPNGWLWRVRSGGWFDLESTRDRFWLSDAPQCELREYLIVADQCVFVLTYTSPHFEGGRKSDGPVA